MPMNEWKAGSGSPPPYPNLTKKTAGSPVFPQILPHISENVDQCTVIDTAIFLRTRCMLNQAGFCAEKLMYMVF